ncbi:MAG TPA: type II toxin-antitoxin system ParD family antitoxin [Tepidisphaeraceae bacterium]|nr:type II toxin-antitoxin system ParD family antitoxin [Tepidisphaeraceae bacterium]
MAREATLSVSLTNQLKSYVLDKVESGQFESASEVIRQGLRTMQEQEQREKLFWADLRKKVKEARTAIAEGDVVDGPEFMRSTIVSLKAKAKQPTAKKKRS